MTRNIGSLCVAGIVFSTLALLASTFASGSDIVVSGRLRHEGVLQIGDGEPSTFETTTGRYVVVAEVADVGTVVPHDHELVQSLCRDLDGCAVVIQMVDKFVSQPGNVHSQTAHLFLSETSDWWRLSADGVRALTATTLRASGTPRWSTNAASRTRKRVPTPASGSGCSTSRAGPPTTIRAG
jgi:hypothetical protein